MAKRRRLGPATLMGQGAEPDSNAPSETGSTPPIAQIAGQAAGEAAAREIADELYAARAEGRMVQDIALTDIDEAHLSRDRIATDATDLAALQASIAARGQQMPIELVDLGAGAVPRYGLISGWRRLAALKALEVDTARAVLRRPDTAADAYLSMVEENELRVGLSYYERAQVAARATDLGVFETSAAAVQALYPTASKAKRSKINAFVRIFRVLDPVLAFPDLIPERLGLRIAKTLDAGQGNALFQGLQQGGPFADARAEQARIEAILTSRTGSGAGFSDESKRYPGQVALKRDKGGLKLSGAGVNEALYHDLDLWLKERQRRGTS